MRSNALPDGEKAPAEIELAWSAYASKKTECDGESEVLSISNPMCMPKTISKKNKRSADKARKTVLLDDSLSIKFSMRKIFEPSPKRGLNCKLLKNAAFLYAFIGFLLVLRATVDVVDQGDGNSPNSCVENPEAETWELSVLSFWSIVTTTCALTLSAFSVTVGKTRWEKKLFVIGCFTVLCLAYASMCRRLVGSMPACEPFGVRNPALDIGSPEILPCRRINTTIDAYANSVCSDTTSPEFIHNKVLESFGIFERQEFLPNVQFIKDLLREFMVPLFVSPSKVESCTNAIVNSICRFFVNVECSPSCQPLFACADYCAEMEKECPGLRRFAAEKTEHIEDLRALFTSAVFDLIRIFILNFPNCDHPWASNRTSNECIPLNGNAKTLEVSGNCTASVWNDYKNDVDKLTATWNNDRNAHIQEGARLQQEWKRKNFRLNGAFIIFMFTIVVPLCAFVLVKHDEEQVVTYTLFCQGFKKVHSPTTLLGIVCLFILAFGVLAMAFIFTIKLQNQPYWFLMWMALAAQYPLFTGISNLVGFQPLIAEFNDIELEEAPAQSRGSVSKKLHQLKDWIHRMRKLVSVKDGKYYIEFLCCAEFFEAALQLFSLFSLAESQDRNLFFLQAAVLSLSIAITPPILITRSRWRSALNDVIFDLAFIFLNFFGLILREADNISFTDGLFLLFPISMVSKLADDIVVYLMAMNYKSRSADGTAAAKASNAQRRARTVVQTSRRRTAIVSASSFGIGIFLFCYVVLRTRRIERRCEAQFGKCVWGRVYPRVYFPDGYFSAGSCDSAKTVTTLDLSGCGETINLVQFVALRKVTLPGTMSTLPGVVGILMNRGELEEVDFEDPANVVSIDWAACNLSSIKGARFQNLFKRLNHVRSINMSRNELEDFVGVVSHFPMLTSLDISRNRLKFIDSEVYLSERKIEVLNIRFNRIEELIGLFARWAFSKEENRTVLFGYNPTKNIRWSHFKGSLPTELGLLTDLERLWLDQNNCPEGCLTGTIPTEIGSLSNLRELNIGSNKLLGGSLPTEIGQLSKLESFKASNTPMVNTTLPSEITQCTKLTLLLMSGMPGLRGTIPTQLGLLKELTELGLGSSHKYDKCSLHGTLPTELGALTALRILGASYTAVGGTIPSELSNLRELRELRLYRNDLLEPLPENLAQNMSNLKTVRITVRNTSRAGSTRYIGSKKSLLKN